MLLSASEPTFSKHVLESSQPVLVYFWAPWCKLCHNIPPTLSKFQDEHPESLKIVSINADETLKLANTYRLKMLPTFLLFEGGAVAHRIEGFHGREELYRTLEKMSRSSSPVLAQC
ncbi:MAG: thioredoxin family protein [Cyanobacteriota bacterium]|nr:thioredoxin family protein [Cyanobacteriota bacterium]